MKIGSSEQLKASDSIKQVSWRTGEDHCKWMSSLKMVKGKIHVLLGNKNAMPYHLQSTVCFFASRRATYPPEWNVFNIPNPQALFAEWVRWLSKIVAGVDECRLAVGGPWAPQHCCRQLVKIIDPEKKVRHLTKLFLEYDPWTQIYRFTDKNMVFFNETHTKWSSTGIPTYPKMKHFQELCRYTFSELIYCSSGGRKSRSFCRDNTTPRISIFAWCRDVRQRYDEHRMSFKCLRNVSVWLLTSCCEWLNLMCWDIPPRISLRKVGGKIGPWSSATAKRCANSWKMVWIVHEYAVILSMATRTSTHPQTRWHLEVSLPEVIYWRLFKFKPVRVADEP